MSNKILYVFLFFSFCSNSQFSAENKRKTDSLVNIVQLSKDNIKIANAFLELSDLYILVDLDSAIYFSGKANTIGLKGYHKVSEKEQKDTFKGIIARASNNTGYALYNKGDFSNALKFYKIALDLWKEIDDQTNVGMALNNMGVVYRKLEEYKKALKFFTEALQSYNPVGDESTIAGTYNNIGSVYKMLEMDKKAMDSYVHSLQIRRKIGDNRGTAITLNNIGALYKKQGELDSALRYFEESLELIKNVGDQMGIAHASCNIGEIALLKDNPVQAKQLGEMALVIGEDLGSLLLIEQATKLLQRVYEKSNQWEEAYKMQTRNIQTNLKLRSEEANKAALLLEMQFQFEKEKEINEINTRKNFAISQKQEQIKIRTIYFISICFILVTIFSTLLYKRLKIMRQQKEIIEKQNNERKVMLQEIHHRVKNNFQIIASMLRLQIHNDKNPILKTAFQEAINRIHTMAIVHEIIYKQDDFDEVEAKMYLEHLISNLHGTFENKKVLIEIDSCRENLGLEHTIPLGIIVNELITNSFKHAFPENHPEPRISISLHKIKDYFELNYKDNGVGFDSSNVRNSFGLELVETVVDQINGKVEIVQDPIWNTNIKIGFIK